jgi:1-deoxy-D-xylulose-5-phosphate synthase
MKFSANIRKVLLISDKTCLFLVFITYRWCSFYDLGQALKNKLREESGVEATLINPRYITGLDEPMLEELKVGHRIVVTLEDGVLDGGFGEKIARYYGNSEMRVLNYGLRKEFADRYNLDELMKANRLTDKQMAEDIAGILE